MIWWSPLENYKVIKKYTVFISWLPEKKTKRSLEEENERNIEPSHSHSEMYYYLIKLNDTRPGPDFRSNFIV